MRILIVGNEDGSARTALTASTKVVTHCTESNADLALVIIENDYFDLVMIEVGPNTHAAHLVRWMRLAKIQTPVLLLSPIDYLVETVRVLSVGANDYISLPFDPETMIKRVFEFNEEGKVRTLPVLLVGRLQIDIERRTLHVDDERVHLTNKEFQMLELLATNQGALVTRNMFFRHIYRGDYDPVPKVIDVLINKLRKKLGVASGESYIETIRGRGYILRAPEAAIDSPNRAASA